MVYITIDKNNLLTLKTSEEITNKNPFVSNQLQIISNDSNNLLNNKTVRESVSYILWNDIWNTCGIFGPSRDIPISKPASFRYVRGRKVFVDFGTGNIGKETSLPHPAFIIYNFPDSAIVVPTTSDDGSVFSSDMEKALIKCPKDGLIFPSNTLINIHQIRVIAKNRIIKDLNCNAVDYILPNTAIDYLNSKLSRFIIPYGIDLKKCIELKIAELFAPDIFYQMVKLQERVELLENLLKEQKNSPE